MVTFVGPPKIPPTPLFQRGDNHVAFPVSFAWKRVSEENPGSPLVSIANGKWHRANVIADVDVQCGSRFSIKRKLVGHRGRCDQSRTVIANGGIGY